MNCRIKSLFVILFFLVGCQGYDDQEPIQRTAAQGVVAMDEDELDGISDEDLFLGQVSAGGVAEHSLASWSASGMLITGGTDEAVQLQADFPTSGPYTLQFSVEVPDGTGGDIGGVAEIDWKVEGNWVHRVVSVASGTAISGTSEGCKVTIRDASNAIGGQPYRVSVQLAVGTRAATAQPPIYQPSASAIGVAAADLLPQKIAVPQNAGIVSIWLSAMDNNGAVPVVPVSGTVMGTLHTAFNVVGYIDLTRPQWYPVPPGVTEVWVYNGTGHDIAFTAPLFGIEG